MRRIEKLNLVTKRSVTRKIPQINIYMEEISRERI